MAKEMADKIKEGKDSLTAAHEYVHENINMQMGDMMIEIVVAQVIIISLLVYIAFFKKHP